MWLTEHGWPGRAEVCLHDVFSQHRQLQYLSYLRPHSQV